MRVCDFKFPIDDPHPAYFPTDTCTSAKNYCISDEDVVECHVSKEVVIRIEMATGRFLLEIWILVASSHASPFHIEIVFNIYLFLYPSAMHTIYWDFSSYNLSQ